MVGAPARIGHYCEPAVDLAGQIDPLPSHWMLPQ